MRLAVFLFVSLGLHAAALTYPAVFVKARAEHAIAVVLVADEEGDGKPGVGGHAETNKGRSVHPQRLPRRTQRVNAEERDGNKSPPELEQSPVVISSVADAPGEGVVASLVALPGNAFGTLSNQSGIGAGGENGPAGNSGSDAGSRPENADRERAAKFIDAAYRYSPKPEYPDSALREGKQGQVILRVLVDEHGRSKSIQVNRSSGVQALDRAAVEAMKRWRFSPARSGDVPVEMWIKVPIEFQLSNAKK